MTAVAAPGSLSPLFTPHSVALIGATETPGSVGRTLFENLTATFPGEIVAVNPSHVTVFGATAYPSITAAPRPVDLAVIATPAPTVPAIVRDCVRAGVRSAIVISAGFRECGAAGALLEQDMLREARRGPIRIVGPNCLGVMNPVSGLNATFARGIASAGHVAFLSQSGALCTAVLDWSRREQIGFSAFVSVGAMADVGWGDLIAHLGRDPQTTSIVLYMESIADARSFVAAAREVARVKPIVAIKAGRTDEAARAAASHTGAITGHDRVLDAAFAQSGVLRVDSIEELFDMAEVLAKQPRPAGPRLCIVTNAGGPGVLATDALIRQGGQLATLAPGTVAALDRCLPSAWSRANPIDILGDADPARYARALSIAAADPASDGLLVVLTPQAMTDPTSTADCLAAAAAGQVKPVLASWMGGTEVAAGQKRLNDAGIPTLPFPDAAAALFAHMARHSRNLCDLDDVSVSAQPPQGSRAAADAVIGAAQRADRTLLTPFESTHLLAAYGLPMLDTRLAPTEEEAVAAAARLGYPVVLKLHSHTVSHKSDVGGVRLNLPDEAGVRAGFRAIRDAVSSGAGQDFLGVTVQPMIDREGAFELIVGSSHDPQFGPVLLFGAGGTLVEIEKDYALALAPLTPAFARRMIAGTRISRAFGGVRGRPAVDAAALERILMLISQCVVNHPRIREIDINPLLVRGETIVAVDARVVLHPATITDDALPQPAIESERCAQHL